MLRAMGSLEGVRESCCNYCCLMMEGSQRGRRNGGEWWCRCGGESDALYAILLIAINAAVIASGDCSVGIARLTVVMLVVVVFAVCLVPARSMTNMIFCAMVIQCRPQPSTATALDTVHVADSAVSERERSWIF